MAYSWIKNKLGCFVFLLLAACGGGGGDSSTTITPPVATTSVNYTYTSSTPEVNLVSTPETDSAALSLSYTLDLGTALRDVYLVFTNPTLVDSTVAPSIYGLSLAADLPAGAEPLAAEVIPMLPPAIGTRGTPDISRFNADPDAFLVGVNLGKSSSLAPSLATVPAPPAVCDDTTAATTQTFKTGVDENNLADTSASCRATVTVDATSLYVWVADASWIDTCSVAPCVSGVMLDSMLTKFLQTGSNNDIYDWVRDIYGEEWGAAADNTMIPYDSSNKSITILLYDIDDDQSTNGGTTGFFWAKDNYLQTYSPGSNERLMFYIDSVLYATPDDTGPWDATDHWPSEIYGTLAHEFQHMINFYQKNIVKGVASEVWLNEMASVMAEDFVATKLGVDGPRGVVSSDPTAGSANNTSGWLPTYCRYDYVPVAQWFTGSSVYSSYAVNYSFGAYLARNYGGVTFFKDLVQNYKSDYSAINYALGLSGSFDDFTTVLRKWGAAVLLSDDSSNAVPAGYRYNTGDFIDAGGTYNLGSINMFNYHHAVTGQSGPTIYTSLPPVDTMAGKYKTSNMFYKWGTGLSGVVSKVITIPQGSKLTVVIK